MRELFADRSYVAYWCAVVVSFAGDAMTKVALVYATSLLTDSALILSVVVIAQLLPTGVLGVFLGPLVDRVRAMPLLLGADSVRAVLSLTLIWLADSACGSS